MKTMKKILLVFLLLTCFAEVFAQTPAQVIWRNGGKDGSIVTLKDAQKGVPLTAGKNKSRTAYSDKKGSISIECSFTQNDFMALSNGSPINFEIKWYNYLSTRKSLMGSNSVTVSSTDVQDGIVKVVCEKNNVSTGWWEVTIKNKKTGEMIRYANQDSYQICFN